jgi:diacylglycerol kinase (ATP)
MNSLKNQPLGQRLRNAVAGLAHALSGERSLRLQALAFLSVLVVLAVLRPGALWFALVLVAGGSVLTAEMFNTALEALSDHLHPAVHPRIRVVKDCAAAAVLIAALTAVGVGIALLLHLAA